MNADTIRLHYTYLLAAVIIIGGGALIVLKLNEIPPEALIAFVSGAFGFVLGFIFNRESTVGGARAQERATAQGIAAGQAAPTEAPAAAAAPAPAPPPAKPGG